MEDKQIKYYIKNIKTTKGFFFYPFAEIGNHTFPINLNNTLLETYEKAEEMIQMDYLKRNFRELFTIVDEYDVEIDESDLKDYWLNEFDKDEK